MSTVSGVSSSVNQYQLNWQNSFNQRQQDFSQLGSALQSGDLASAQSAYSALFQNTSSSSPTQNSQQSGNSGIQSDVDALGKALQSGDVDAAKSAYAKLQQDFQSAHAHHHHHQTQSAQLQNTSAANSVSDLLSIASGDSNANAIVANSSVDISG